MSTSDSKTGLWFLPLDDSTMSTFVFISSQGAGVREGGGGRGGKTLSPGNRSGNVEKLLAINKCSNNQEDVEECKSYF